MLSGSVADYDVAAQTAIKTVLAAEAKVSTSAVSLTFTAGSVLVAADIFFATQAGARRRKRACVRRGIPTYHFRRLERPRRE